MRRRALRDAQTPVTLKRNCSLAANNQLSMEDKKRKIIRNLRRLESLGLVDSAHQYQELINQLAKVCWGTLIWDVTSLKPPEISLVCFNRALGELYSFSCMALFPPGHPQPAAVPAAPQRGAPEAATDLAGPQRQDLVLRGANRLLQPVHQDLSRQPGGQQQVCFLTKKNPIVFKQYIHFFIAVWML